MNSFWLIDDYIFANDFLRFLTGHFRKTQKVMFFENWKNVKYVFSKTGLTCALSVDELVVGDGAVTMFAGRRVPLQPDTRRTHADSCEVLRSTTRHYTHTQ